jgi:hypothetical protein
MTRMLTNPFVRPASAGSHRAPLSTLLKRPPAVPAYIVVERKSIASDMTNRLGGPIESEAQLDPPSALRKIPSYVAA